MLETVTLNSDKVRNRVRRSHEFNSSLGREVISFFFIVEHSVPELKLQTRTVKRIFSIQQTCILFLLFLTNEALEMEILNVCYRIICHTSIISMRFQSYF